MKQKHKYRLTIEFESEVPVKKHANAQVQFENALPHFVYSTDGEQVFKHYVGDAFVPGTGRVTLTKRTKQ